MHKHDIHCNNTILQQIVFTFFEATYFTFSQGFLLLYVLNYTYDLQISGKSEPEIREEKCIC